MFRPNNVGTDRRREPRRPASGAVSLTWKGEGLHHLHSTQAHLADKSDGGCSLTTPETPQIGMSVCIQDVGERRWGTLRYAVRAGMDYRIGLELERDELQFLD